MRFDKLDLNLLVALDALLEDRSVSLAAKRLNLTQPALSSALNRLRDFFQDDLLVQAGRTMIPTAKAQELASPVRQALTYIRSTITTPATFEPETAARIFSIAASDYVYTTLLANVIAEASYSAPNVRFEVVPTERRANEKLERGELDILITVNQYLLGEHPRLELYSDEHAVVAWSESVHRDGVTEQSFFEAGHAVAFFGPDKHPAFTESFFEQSAATRRIELRVSTFSALALGVIGTQRIATMYRRHAEYFARYLPICIHRTPMPMPDVTEAVQWHQMRENDQGVRWLVGKLKAESEQLSAK